MEIRLREGAGRRRQVNHDGGIPQRTAEGVYVLEAANDRRDVVPLEQRGVTARAHQRSGPGTTTSQRFDEMRSDEAGRAGD